MVDDTKVAPSSRGFVSVGRCGLGSMFWHNIFLYLLFTYNILAQNQAKGKGVFANKKILIMPLDNQTVFMYNAAIN